MIKLLKFHITTIVLTFISSCFITTSCSIPEDIEKEIKSALQSQNTPEKDFINYDKLYECSSFSRCKLNMVGGTQMKVEQFYSLEFKTNNLFNLIRTTTTTTHKYPTIAVPVIDSQETSVTSDLSNMSIRQLTDEENPVTTTTKKTKVSYKIIETSFLDNGQHKMKVSKTSNTDETIDNSSELTSPSETFELTIQVGNNKNTIKIISTSKYIQGLDKESIFEIIPSISVKNTNKNENTNSKVDNKESIDKKDIDKSINEKNQE